MRKIVLGIMVVILAGCQSAPQFTKEQLYPLMYAEKPLSIVVAPIINKSTAADAGDLYQTTIAKPLAEAGYYVVSVPFSKRILEQEGLVDGQQLEAIEVSSFRDIFGADAVLLVTIQEWDTNYYVVGGNVTVSLAMSLKSTHSNEQLWHYSGKIVVDTQGDSTGGYLGKLIATAINTAQAKYVDAAEQVNNRVVFTMPRGQHHQGFMKDQKVPTSLLAPQLAAAE
ncbi:MAG: DUF799 family lipoprotein [Shewanellaceae bacterium]|nr:DUF799 family lipoprotein [Shewanellaceae bacterium]